MAELKYERETILTTNSQATDGHMKIDDSSKFLIVKTHTDQSFNVDNQYALRVLADTELNRTQVNQSFTDDPEHSSYSSSTYMSGGSSEIGVLSGVSPRPDGYYKVRATVDFLDAQIESAKSVVDAEESATAGAFTAAYDTGNTQEIQIKTGEILEDLFLSIGGKYKSGDEDGWINMGGSGTPPGTLHSKESPIWLAQFKWLGTNEGEPTEWLFNKTNASDQNLGFVFVPFGTHWEITNDGWDTIYTLVEQSTDKFEPAPGQLYKLVISRGKRIYTLFGDLDDHGISKDRVFGDVATGVRGVVGDLYDIKRKLMELYYRSWFANPLSYPELTADWLNASSQSTLTTYLLDHPSADFDINKIIDWLNECHTQANTAHAENDRYHTFFSFHVIQDPTLPTKTDFSVVTASEFQIIEFNPGWSQTSAAYNPDETSGAFSATEYTCILESFIYTVDGNELCEQLTNKDGDPLPEPKIEPPEGWEHEDEEDYVNIWKSSIKKQVQTYRDTQGGQEADWLDNIPWGWEPLGPPTAKSGDVDKYDLEHKYPWPQESRGKPTSSDSDGTPWYECESHSCSTSWWCCMFGDVCDGYTVSYCNKIGVHPTVPGRGL